MKRIFIGVLAITMLMIAGSGAALAQEGNGVNVGLKMWINDWTRDVPGAASITSDTTTLLGPAIEAKFGGYFFGEASFLFSTADYNFPDTGQKLDRQDVDLAIGYWIIPEIGILVGYKDTEFKWKTTYLGEKDTLSGPVIGVVGDFPVDPYLSFYGRLDYLFTRFKQGAAVLANDTLLPNGTVLPKGTVLPASEEDSPGWIFEFGLKYAFTNQFKWSIGYKYETNEGSNSSVRDSFSGLTLGAMISF